MTEALSAQSPLFKHAWGLQDVVAREGGERRQKRETRGLRRVCSARGAKSEIPRKKRCACDRQWEKRCHGPRAEVSAKMPQVLGQELLVQVAHAQEHVELGALAHDPQHQEGPHAGLVGAAPGTAAIDKRRGADAGSVPCSTSVSPGSSTCSGEGATTPPAARLAELRPDVVTEGGDAAGVLAAAAVTHDGRYFVVPRVVE